MKEIEILYLVDILRVLLTNLLMLVNLITAKLHKIRDIAAEINVDEGDAAKVIPTHKAALEAIETLREYFEGSFGRDGTFHVQINLKRIFIKNYGQRKKNNL